MLYPLSSNIPVACTISATSPDKPGSLCLFIFFNSNFIDPDAICWSFFNSSRYSVFPFILFFCQLFDVLLPRVFNPFLVSSFHSVDQKSVLWAANTQLVSLLLLLGITALPRGLQTSLCHAFIVFIYSAFSCKCVNIIIIIETGHRWGR